MKVRVKRRTVVEPRALINGVEQVTGPAVYVIDGVEAETRTTFSLRFDADPTDADVVVKVRELVGDDGADIDPGPTNGRRAIFEAAAAAAATWDALDRLNAKIQAPETGATNKQKTGAQALADRAYVRARRLASDYADAVSE